MCVFDFKNKTEFSEWLKENHLNHSGIDIFLYKKGSTHLGLSYEDAVCTALCFGWIDSVTHSYDDVKFIQYFAPRLKKSNWSLSNIKRMKYLIESKKMTEAGLCFFDLSLLDQIEEMNQEEKKLKLHPPEMPAYVKDVFIEFNMLDRFLSESSSVQKRYIAYIEDAKQMSTKIRRCQKIIGILNGEKNNL